MPHDLYVTHYGWPEEMRVRPACGTQPVASQTNDKALVNCRRCKTTLKWRVDWCAPTAVKQ